MHRPRSRPASPTRLPTASPRRHTSRVFQHIDTALRSLLLAALPVGTDVDFGRPPLQPASDRAAVNPFLHRIQEDPQGSASGWIDQRDVNGRVVSRQPTPRHFYACYLVTAWASTPAAEHALLGAALAAFGGEDSLRPEFTGVLGNGGFPISLSVAKAELPSAPLEIFSALSMPARACFDVVVTAPLLPTAVTELDAPPSRIDLGMGQQAQATEIAQEQPDGPEARVHEHS